MATASFPCTDLSLAGQGRGLSGEHSSTFFAFTDVITELGNLQPKLILIENVRGLLTSDKGKDFRAVATTLADLGYFLDSFVLDAVNFVPQSRERVFIVGVHRSVVGASSHLVTCLTGGSMDPWRAKVESSSSLRPERLVRLMSDMELPTGWIATIKPPPNRRGPLGGLIDLGNDQDWWSESQVKKHCEMMSRQHWADAEKRRDSGAVHVGTVYRRTREGKPRAEVRFDDVAGCLRVPSGGSSRQIVIVIDRGDLKMRWMSPREYARLQGAPDFPLVGTVNQQLAGFGDAVCVPVIRWIDQTVLTPIFDTFAANGQPRPARNQ